MMYNDEMDYISYSQYNTYTSCPRSWYLSKIRKAEEKQTWYIPIGSAVHQMIEDHLDLVKRPEYRVENQRAEDFFYPLIEKQMLIEPDTSKWMAGGPKDAPIKEEKALQMVIDCFEKALEELEAIDVWEVEYDASGSLPGLSVQLKAYVDIIGEHKKKKFPTIWDWKSGSTKPDNFQLETYGSLLKRRREFSQLDFKGRYIMLSPAYKSTTRYVDLSKVDPLEVGKKYQAVYDQMQALKYQAKNGFNCRFCFHQENCKANAGLTSRTIYYDKSDEDGIPF